MVVVAAVAVGAARLAVAPHVVVVVVAPPCWAAWLDVAVVATAADAVESAPEVAASGIVAVAVVVAPGGLAPWRAALVALAALAVAAGAAVGRTDSDCFA